MCPTNDKSMLGKGEYAGQGRVCWAGESMLGKGESMLGKGEYAGQGRVWDKNIITHYIMSNENNQ